MNTFNQFNVKITKKGFEGDKIKINKIMNREIVIHDFEIKDSKVFADRGSGKCLKLQISFNNEKHIVFTSGASLIEAIQQIPEKGFPFTATIVEENDRFIFT